jgi:hypothetical protein
MTPALLGRLDLAWKEADFDHRAPPIVVDSPKRTAMRAAFTICSP